jgi:hypothetical protein
MASVLKLFSIIALVSLGQGTHMYILKTRLHLAQDAQLSWFPAQAGQLAATMDTVYSFLLI